MARERPGLNALCEAALGLWPAKSIEHCSPLARLPQSILMVKVHGMGDAVMVRSLIEHFQRRHPEVRLGLLAGQGNRDVLSGGIRAQIHEYRQDQLGFPSILGILSGLRRTPYDAVLNFEQGSVVGTAFLRLTDIPIRISFLPLAQTVKGRFLTHALRFRAHESMWTSFVRLIKVVDPSLPDDVTPLPLPVSTGASNYVHDWLFSQGAAARRLVAFHIGSSFRRALKRWPVERFVTLAERLHERDPNVTIILTGQIIERPLIERFQSLYSGNSLDASTLGSIENTAALLERCDLLVSNDTGVMHLGAAMGTPTVGIFGVESPQRWQPIGRHVASVYAGVMCSPCGNTYLLRDPRDCANPDRLICLREITVDMVLEACDSVAGEGGLSGDSLANGSYD
jgi:ADP-heptose:LPS heptosyltransferase